MITSLSLSREKKREVTLSRSIRPSTLITVLLIVENTDLPNARDGLNAIYIYIHTYILTKRQNRSFVYDVICISKSPTNKQTKTDNFN